MICTTYYGKFGFHCRAACRLAALLRMGTCVKCARTAATCAAVANPYLRIPPNAHTIQASCNEKLWLLRKLVMYPSSPICKGGVRQSANQTTKKSSGAIRPASVSITQSPASIRQSDNHMDQSSNQTITWTNQAIRQSHGPIRQSDNHVDQSGNQTIGMVVIQSMRKSGHQTTNRSTKARRRGKEAIRINQSDNHANKRPCNQAITRWSRCEAYPKATLMIQDSPPVVDSGQ
jgi:hypothetical protein